MPESSTAAANTDGEKPERGKVTLPRPLTNEEINQLVKDWLAGKIFFSAEIDDPADVQNVFLPIAVAPHRFLADLGREGLSQVTVYGRMRDAGPASINGYPMFDRMTLLLIDDFTKVAEKVERAREAIGRVLAEE